MSFEAIAAVMESDLSPPSLKLAAVAMANFLNSETGQLNPSMSRIAKACGLSEIQARRQVHELIAMGVLSVVANHQGGSSGASRQYLMHLDRLPGTPITSDSPPPLASESPLPVATPLADERDPSHGRSPPLSPVIGTPLASERRTRKEPGMNQEENQEERKRPPAISRPPDVGGQTWSDWMALRKAKKAPVTETVLSNAIREAKTAGMSLEAFLQVWCLRGSQGLQASWLKPQERQLARSRHASFENMNYREGTLADGSLV